VLKTFDAWSAWRLPENIAAVICYENSARKTFQVAKQKGITTILDAASFHYRWQDKFYDPVETDGVHQEINAYKEEEIELADHILTVSDLARESYIDAGVPSEQVTAVPMGMDLSAFTPPDDTKNDLSGALTFLFAGHAGRRKGVDVLLAASERLTNEGGSHRLQFAGSVEVGLFEDTDAQVECLGYLSTPELAEAFRQADVLVLPSRHDSFGRVVVEAMASGLPVIVSEHVGAKELVTEGETGWMVPAEDVEALATRMKWCIKNHGKVRNMSLTAIERAQDYSWAAYRKRVVDVIATVVS
jgi:glycosyltransferase involved in cell wall biosynthesis